MMTAVLQLIKKHPVALGLYCLYTAQCCRLTVSDWELTRYLIQHTDVRGMQSPHSETIAWGESIALGYIVIVFIGVLFFLVCGCIAIADKREAKFYLLLALIAVLQPIIFIQVGHGNWR